MIRVCLLVFVLALFLHYSPLHPQSPALELTAAVLVNSANPAGYRPNPPTPEQAGDFQRYLERYLEHLQIPYDLLDVNPSVTPTPPDLSNRQLIMAGHKGLALTPDWQEAVRSAVEAGTGFLNLDSDPTVGSNAHIQAIFSATGSGPGTPSKRIVVPADVAASHYIAAWQQKLPADPPGDFVYDFHRKDSSGAINRVTATVLTGARGTVIAQLVSDDFSVADPLILATTYGAGRAVHFGTYDYLKADRFGFLMGVDDLFWRSAVWAARKPFVLRGYPRFWAVQMDDTLRGWGDRVRDLYDPALTGGNPWQVTGYIYYKNLPPGDPERASVMADINAGNLQVSPHSKTDFNGGNFYFNGTQPLTDAQWAANLDDCLTWQQGQGGSDTVPFLSRSMVPHWWDLSDNTGADMWNLLGIRYVTTIQKPNYFAGARDERARLRARPFRLYELPPSGTYMPRALEDYPMFFADDYTVNSAAGQPPQTFFLFLTQVHDRVRYGRFRCNLDDDVRWPVASFRCSNSINPDPPPNITAADSVDMFQYTTWRFWSSLAPVELYNHDSNGLSRASVADRRAVIRDVSQWLNARGVEHVFMQDLGDYIYARTKSVLVRATYADGRITYTFTGQAATADGQPVDTRLFVFTDDQPEGAYQTIPGFIGGLTLTLPLP